MTTDERIENLEMGLIFARRFNRWLLAAAGLALGVWILAGTFGPTGCVSAGRSAVEEVRANRFVAEDENGKDRAILDVSKDGPGLVLYDENNKPRAMLDVSKAGPGLVLYGENGKPRAMLNVDKAGPGLVLYDENDKPRVMLNVDKAGSGLVLYDENDKPRAMLDMSKDGPRLSLRDEKGKRIWQAPQSAAVAVTPGTK